MSSHSGMKNSQDWAQEIRKREETKVVFPVNGKVEPMMRLQQDRVSM